MVVRGTTTGTFIGTALETAAIIKSYSLTNKSGGSNTVITGIILGSSVVEFCRHPLGANESVRETLTHIIVPKGYAIYISVGGTCDYFLSIE